MADDKRSNSANEPSPAGRRSYSAQFAAIISSDGKWTHRKPRPLEQDIRFMFTAEPATTPPRIAEPANQVSSWRAGDGQPDVTPPPVEIASPPAKPAAACATPGREVRGTGQPPGQTRERAQKPGDPGRTQRKAILADKPGEVQPGGCSAGPAFITVGAPTATRPAPAALVGTETRRVDPLRTGKGGRQQCGSAYRLSAVDAERGR